MDLYPGKGRESSLSLLRFQNDSDYEIMNFRSLSLYQRSGKTPTCRILLTENVGKY